jgi:hypothetical protein
MRGDMKSILKRIDVLKNKNAVTMFPRLHIDWETMTPSMEYIPIKGRYTPKQIADAEENVRSMFVLFEHDGPDRDIRDFEE